MVAINYLSQWEVVWIDYRIVRSNTRMTNDQVHPGYIYLCMLRTLSSTEDEVEDESKKERRIEQFNW